MPSLAELFKKRKEAETVRNSVLAKTISSSTAGALGATAGKVDARAQNRRMTTLRQLLNAGEIKPEELGPQDRRDVGPQWLRQFMTVTPPGEGDSSFLGIGGPVGASVGNFFGGAVDFAKGLPGGIYMTGKSLGSDVAYSVDHPSGLLQTGGRIPSLSESMPSTSKNIVDPTIQYYKAKYSGSPREILHKALVEDPFGTVLDVGTIASMGVGAAGKGGSIASKAGEAVEFAGEPGSSLSRFGGKVRGAGDYLKQFGYEGTRGKRPDLIAGKNIPIPREYGVSPIVRAGQKLTDKYLDRVPTVGERLSNLRGKLAQHRIINTTAGRERILGSFMAATESKGFVKAAKKLDDDESVALTLLKNGVSMQPVRPAGGVQRGMVSALDAFKEYLDASLEGKLPGGYNARELEPLGVDPTTIEALRAKLDDPELIGLIEKPSPSMVKASDEWDSQVDRNLQTHPIDPEEHVKRVYAPQQALRVKPERLLDDVDPSSIEAIKDPTGAFDRYSAKYAEDTGEAFPIRPNYIPHELAEGKFAGSLTKTERSKPVPRISLANDLVAKQHPNYLSTSDMQAFLSGAVRMGTQPMVDFIQRREAYLAHDGMIGQLIDKLAEKNQMGEVVRASNTSDMRAKGYSPETHVALDLEGAVRFYKNEDDFLKTLTSMVDEVKKDSPKDVADRADAITQGVKEFAELSGRKTVQEVVGAAKPDGIVMTRDAANHIKSTLEAMRPAETKVGRGYDRMMSMWRSATLGFMPRWWINTFVGSTFMMFLSGSANPRYLIAAARYGGRGERASRLMKEAPELRPGIFGEQVEAAADIGQAITRPGKALHKLGNKIFGKVEDLESFFKRAGFFHEMDKQARAAMRDIGEVMDEYNDSPYMRDEYINNILDNHPEMVDHALNEVNRFFYNYTSLGPMERRYVRRVVPFWGWYKFVTKLVYQLPFQYPGRTFVLDKMSRIAQDFQDDELGILPVDVQGAIFLNANRSKEEYIPTFGLNPLSDFANPAAPEGTLQGLLSTQQLAPLFGAFIQSIGMDPYRGAPNELSPEDNLLMGRFGRVINPDTGEEVPGGISGAFSTERLLGSLLRSVPQVRNLEIMNAGGRYVYPESIPFINEKPVPVEAGDAYGGQGSTSFLLRSFLGGFPPKTENLRDYQNTLQEDVKYGEGAKENQMKRLRKSGVR
jgi:hypothetical protein